MRESQAREEISKHLLSIFTCSVCGEHLYQTDQCNLETTLHCSSSEARFWDFERGSLEQLKAKEHWDKSRKAVHLENI
jgi:hypothetical protein